MIIGTNAVILVKCKSFGTPAALLNILFGAQMLLSLLLLQADIGGVYCGFFWLAAAIFVFALGSYLMRRRYLSFHPVGRSVTRASAGGYEVYDSRMMKIILIILLLLSLIQPLSFVYRLGYGIPDFFSLHKLLEMNAAAANARYVSKSYLTSAFTQVFLALVYLLPMIGGWNIIFSKRAATRVLCVCTIAPSLLVLLTQNTKAAFIGSALLFLSSLITARYQKTGAFFRLRAKSLFFLIPIAAVFLLLNYISFFLRNGDISLSLFVEINNKVLNYLLGQIPAFNSWFSGSFTASGSTFGLKTFYALPDALGLMKRNPGIYTVKLVTAHLNTNVYTAFRPLVEDFTAIGALVVLFLAGALSGFCFERLRAGRARCLDLVFLTSLYFYIFYAFITSPWAYVSYTAAVILFFGYLLLMRKHVLLKQTRI